MQSSVENDVALVGAYERDNFGDLLFLLVTEKLLKNTQNTVTATAPFYADMTSILNREILSFGTYIRDHTPKGVWVAGGEVGGTTLRDAIRMSLPESIISSISKKTKKELNSYLLDNYNLYSEASPYLPRPSAFKNTSNTASIVNSVGLSGIANLTISNQNEALSALREADFISVRDIKSSKLLSKKGIEHSLAPDIVHTLKFFPDFQKLEKTNTALVQIKKKLLLEVGIDEFSSAIANSKELKKYEKIELFSAGEATGHDSVELYKEVRNRILDKSPDLEILIYEDPDPLAKALRIASASLWVGTSLHGAIISSTFSVPHVALILDKLSNYMRTWGDPAPNKISVQEIDSGIAKSYVANAEKVNFGHDIATLALSNFNSAVSALDTVKSRSESRQASSLELQKRQDSIKTKTLDSLFDLKKRIRG